MHLMWLLAQQSVETVLLERGVLGALVLILGVFSYQTIKVTRSDLREALERERKQQHEIYTKTIPVLDRITAVVDARATLDKAILDALSDVRRLLEQRQV